MDDFASCEEVIFIWMSVILVHKGSQLLESLCSTRSHQRAVLTSGKPLRACRASPIAKTLSRCRAPF